MCAIGSTIPPPKLEQPPTCLAIAEKLLRPHMILLPEPDDVRSNSFDEPQHCLGESRS